LVNPPYPALTVGPKGVVLFDVNNPPRLDFGCGSF
jgi:hypothetical protein